MPSRIQSDLEAVLGRTNTLWRKQCRIHDETQQQPVDLFTQERPHLGNAQSEHLTTRGAADDRHRQGIRTDQRPLPNAFMASPRVAFKKDRRGVLISAIAAKPFLAESLAAGASRGAAERSRAGAARGRERADAAQGAGDQAAGAGSLSGAAGAGTAETTLGGAPAQCAALGHDALRLGAAHVAAAGLTEQRNCRAGACGIRSCARNGNFG
jgi:hypothetical protein